MGPYLSEVALWKAKKLFHYKYAIVLDHVKFPYQYLIENISLKLKLSNNLKITIVKQKQKTQLSLFLN